MNESLPATMIFGATRGTGLEVARLLAQAGQPVVAVVRASSDTTELQSAGVSCEIADIFDPADVERLLAAYSVQALVLSLSGQRGEERRADREGVQVIVDAAVKDGVARALMITAIGCGDSRGAVAPKVIEILGEVLAAKTVAEEYLLAADIDAVILRPGGMTHDPATGTAIRSEDHSLMGVINRADLAALTLEALRDPAAAGRIYHTVDPEITWQAPLQRGEDVPKQD